MTPGSTWNTPTAPPPLIVTSPVPGLDYFLPRPSRRGSASPVSATVCAVAKTVGSNSISLPLVPVFGVGTRQEGDIGQRARRPRARESPAGRVDRIGGDRIRDQVGQAVNETRRGAVVDAVTL